MTLADFLRSERTGGFLLLGCTVVAIAIANSPAAAAWESFWHAPLGPLTLQHWVNDGLMALFFLLVGLELEREIYVGELSDPRAAMLPIVAACGGVLVPAAIHYALNGETPTQAGAGIPMATDIAFALAALSVLGSRVPLALKIFLAALAVIDDLIAIVVIALAYSGALSAVHLAGAGLLLAAMIAMNRLGVRSLVAYGIAGLGLWGLLLGSGVHATLAGIALAFAIPFRSAAPGVPSPSAVLEHRLHRPVALLVLPVFALANAGVPVTSGLASLAEPNALGILLGLVVGKPLGITVACLIAVAVGIRRPATLAWRHVVGGGMLAGIGFTMSIFVANLAFPAMPELVNQSKLAILVASFCSAALGIAWLSCTIRPGRSAS